MGRCARSLKTCRHISCPINRLFLVTWVQNWKLVRDDDNGDYDKGNVVMTVCFLFSHQILFTLCCAASDIENIQALLGAFNTMLDNFVTALFFGFSMFRYISIQVRWSGRFLCLLLILGVGRFSRTKYVSDTSGCRALLCGRCAEKHAKFLTVLHVKYLSVRRWLPVLTIIWSAHFFFFFFQGRI